MNNPMLELYCILFFPFCQLSSLIERLAYQKNGARKRAVAKIVAANNPLFTIKEHKKALIYGTR